MNKIENNTFNEAQYAAVKNSLSPNDYQEFISFKRSQADFEAFKENQRFEGRKSEAGQDYFSRKAGLINRRVKKQGLDAKFAPDEDVLAYLDIHKLEKAKKQAAGTYKDKEKISVSDEDIRAFRSLENEGFFYKDITLQQIEQKVAEIKAANNEVKKDEVKKDEGSVAGSAKVVEITDYTVEDGPSDKSATEEKTPEDPAPENETTEEEIPTEE